MRFCQLVAVALLMGLLLIKPVNAGALVTEHCTKADIAALKKEMGKAWPEEFVEVAFDAPPYDRVYKLKLAEELPRTRYIGFLIGQDGVLDYLNLLPGFLRYIHPQSVMQHVNDAAPEALRASILRYYPSGTVKQDRFTERVSFYMYVEDAPGKVGATPVNESIDFLARFEHPANDRDTFSPAPHCDIARERNGYEVRRTIAISRFGASQGDTAQCLMTAMMVHYGLSNAKNIYAHEEYVTKKKGKYQLGRANIPYHYLYKSPDDKLAPAFGESICAIVEHVLEKQTSTCLYSLDSLKNNPSKAAALSPQYQKLCSNLGIKLQSVQGTTK
jgi:hypothetical protein